MPCRICNDLQIEFEGWDPFKKTQFGGGPSPSTIGAYTVTVKDLTESMGTGCFVCTSLLTGIRKFVDASDIKNIREISLDIRGISPSSTYKVIRAVVWMYGFAYRVELDFYSDDCKH